MRELVKDLHAYTGWRIAFVYAVDMRFTYASTSHFSFGLTDDLRTTGHIQTFFPESDLCGGFVSRNRILVRYLGEQGDTPFKSFCHVSRL